MKQTTVLTGFFLILTLCSYGQFTAQMEGGMSWGKCATVGAFGGFKTPAIDFSAGFDAHLSNRVKNGIVMQVRAAHEFGIDKTVFISPFLGYSYNYLSDDTKSLNSSHLLYGVLISKAIETRNGENLRFYMSEVKSGQYFILSMGIQGIFSRD